MSLFLLTACLFTPKNDLDEAPAMHLWTTHGDPPEAFVEDFRKASAAAQGSPGFLGATLHVQVVQGSAMGALGLDVWQSAEQIQPFLVDNPDLVDLGVYKPLYQIDRDGPPPEGHFSAVVPFPGGGHSEGAVTTQFRELSGLASEQPGWSGSALLVRQTPGEESMSYMSMTLWESKAAAMAFPQTKEFRETLTVLAQYEGQPESFSLMEVHR